MATLPAGAVVPVSRERAIEVGDDLELGGSGGTDVCDLAGKSSGVGDDGVGGHSSGEEAREAVAESTRRWRPGGRVPAARGTREVEEEAAEERARGR